MLRRYSEVENTLLGSTKTYFNQKETTNRVREYYYHIELHIVCSYEGLFFNKTNQINH